MIDLESRLEAVLVAAADSVHGPPLSPARPRALARRRRRRQLAGRSLLAVAVAAGSVAAVDRVTDRSVSLDTADGSAVDADGMPVSTGPALEWREVDGPGSGAAAIVWSGERFVALVDVVDKAAGAGTALAVSSDGASWEPLAGPLPTGMRYGGLTSAEGRLVLWTPLDPTAQLWISNDHGETWTEGPSIDPMIVAPDPDPDDPLVPVTYLGERSVAVVDDAVVVVMERAWLADLDRVLAAGVLASGGLPPNQAEAVEMWQEWTENQVSISYCPVATLDDGTCPEDVAEITYPLGAEDSYQALAFAAPLDPVPVGQPWTSFEQATGLGPAWSRIELVASGDRFTVMAWDSEEGSGDALLMSTDGALWQPWDPGLELADVSSIVALPGDDGIVVFSGGRTPTAEVLRPTGSGEGTARSSIAFPAIAPFAQASGQGGVVMVVEPALPEAGPVKRFFSWILSTGVPADQTDPVVGWSGDGQTWGWESLTTSFGGDGWPAFGVGDDVVVASVLPTTGDGGRASARWFVADVP